MPVPSPYSSAWPQNEAKEPADLRAVLDDIEQRLGQASSGGGSSYGLDFTGEDNRALLEAVIAQEIAAGRDHMIVAPPTGATNPTVAIDGLVRIQNYARAFTLEFRRCRLRYGPSAEIRADGREVEGPDVGKAKLWANVDASGGPVTSFDIDVSANPSAAALFTTGARVRIRGRNGADGLTLDGHRHEAVVVSMTNVSGDRWTLEISPGLPNSVPSGIWYRIWDGSDWNPSVGGPESDDTLLSVLTEMLIDDEIADTAEIPVPSGFDAAAAFPVGSWVVVQSDARTQDLVSGGGSNELVNRHLFQVVAHLTTPARVLIDMPFPGTLYQEINSVDMRPRMTLAQPSIEPTVIFDPSYPIQVVGTVPAPPAPRRHIVQFRYAVRPRARGLVLRGADNASDVHGALVREHVCIDGYHRGLYRSDAKHKATGGSGNGVWFKNSRGSIVTESLMIRCRHGLTDGGGYGTSIVRNVVVDSWESAIDTGHGEMGHFVSAVGNHVFAGRDALDRPLIKGIESSNNSALAGDNGAIIKDNHFYGFKGLGLAAFEAGFGGAIAIVLRSGARGTRISGNVIHGPCDIGVSIQVDRRAPWQGMNDIRIEGDFGPCEAGVLSDAQAPLWQEATAYAGTASRPTHCEHEGHLWSTTASATSGSAPPDPGVEPEIGVTTHDDGEIVWTYQGLVPRPIDGVTISARIDGASVPIGAYRIDRLSILEGSISGPGGIVLRDCPNGLIHNLRARVDADGYWLIDQGGNGGTILAWPEVGGSDIDGSGGSSFVVRTGGGGGGGEIPAGIDAIVRLDGSGNVALATLESDTLEIVGGELQVKTALLSLSDVLRSVVTTARELTTDEDAAGIADRHGQLRIIPINLGSAGTMRVPVDAAVGQTWHVTVNQNSEPVSVGVTGDAGSVAVGASAPVSGGSADLIPGGEAIIRVTSNPGSAPVVRVIGAKSGKTVYGPLVAGGTGSSLPHSLSGFNTLALEAPEETESFVFDETQAGRIVPGNHGSTPIVATIPTNAAVPYPIGTVLAIEQTGAAAVSIAPDGGVTCAALTGRTLAAAGQGSLIGVRKRATDTWRPVGDFAAS